MISSEVFWRSFSPSRIVWPQWVMVFLGGLYYSFPVQLFLLHFQRNQWLLGLWVLIASFFSQFLGNTFGIPYLFLNPEYLNRVWFWSFFILGGTLGLFTGFYHMICYILYSNRFAFLGLLRHPFGKFVINNSLLPICFHLFFFTCILRFQYVNNLLGLYEHLLGYVLGLVGLLILFHWHLYLIGYFFRYFSTRVDRKLKRLKINRGQAMRHLAQAKRKNYTLRTFLDEKLRVCFLSRMPGDYDKRKALIIFNKDHLNILLLGVVLLVGIFLAGNFREYAFVKLPAAASLLLFFSLILLLIGALRYWFGSWSYPMVLLIVLSFHAFFPAKWARNKYFVAGMDYTGPPATYDKKQLQVCTLPMQQAMDKKTTQDILHAWRNKYPADVQPKFLIVMASGGGVRSALWTMRTMQMADSVLQGELMCHTALITGASGGILGAAYYREIYLRNAHTFVGSAQDKKYLQRISTDVLNPIIFSFLYNDLLLQPYVLKNNPNYPYDRGHAFEEQLHVNTQYVLDKKLIAYCEPERMARIPMLIVRATIANDGRRIYFSPQPLSYMIDAMPKTGLCGFFQPLGIDFRSFFKEQGADNLSFMTALRMNATFPYILPAVQLPSKPPIYAVDAGNFDNYGMVDAVKFIHVFREWLRVNTSGVVLLAIRDHSLGKRAFDDTNMTLFHQLLLPVLSTQRNATSMQALRNQEHLQQLQALLNLPVYVVALSYIPDNEDEKDNFKASLSWRLTSKEKASIIDNIHKKHNQEALMRLKGYLLPQQ